MNVNELLWWEKWRPKTLDDIVLPKRILNRFKGGLDSNYIFYGNYGTGKTSLARILIGKYTKDTAYLEINSSLDKSIVLLRNEIEDFCKFKPIIGSETQNKYVFLDEFEEVSPDFQKAFKAFIEKYSKNGVRFILTTNNLNKIDGGIKSRIPKLNFNPENPQEERVMKQQLLNRIVNVVLPKENIKIEKKLIVDLINRKFPDLRSIMVEIQILSKNESIDNNYSNDFEKDKLDLYDLVYNPNLRYDQIYYFLMERFGPEKVDILFNILGTSFIEWSIKNNKNVDKLFKCNWIISDHQYKLDFSSDPIVLAMSAIGKLRDTII